MKIFTTIYNIVHSIFEFISFSKKSDTKEYVHLEDDYEYLSF